MLKYIFYRLLRSILSLIIISLVVFFLLRLMPEEGYFAANPGTSEKITDEQKEAILIDLGLRDPLHIQIKDFYVKLFQGDFGKSSSYRYNVPVKKIIMEKAPYSIYLGINSLAIAVLAGLGLGILMSINKYGFWDKIGTGYIVFVRAVPPIVYFLAIQIYLTDFFKLPILFSSNKPISWVIPILSLSLGSIAGYAMWMRRYMVDELNKDYLRLAYSKGLSKPKVMINHVVRNAIVPLVQFLPTSIVIAIGGSIYIESLYSIPGLGGLLVASITYQDNQIVQILVLIFSSLGIISLFVGDILIALIDPRIKFSKKGGIR